MNKINPLKSSEIYEKSNNCAAQFAIINKQLHMTPRLVEQSLWRSDFTELSLLQKQISFAKLLEQEQYRYFPLTENKDICQITNEEENDFRYEKFKIYEENNTMEIIGESGWPYEKSYEFFFDISNSNIIKKEFTTSNNYIKSDLPDDVESIINENYSESSSYLDSIQESSYENIKNKCFKNPKKWELYNKADFSQVNINQISVRGDLMNKNILRAIKREWKNLFHSFWTSNNIKFNEQNNQYLGVIKNFAHYLIEHASITKDDLFLTEVLNSIAFSSEESNFVVYLGIFTDYWAMKKILKNSIHHSKLVKINEVLYKFTQTKFYELVSTHEVNAIIQLIWSITNLSNFISKNSALSENEEEYRERIENLFIHYGEWNEKD